MTDPARIPVPSPAVRARPPAAAVPLRHLLAVPAGLWAIAILAWGLPALVAGALAAVPVCFALLLLLTRG